MGWPFLSSQMRYAVIDRLEGRDLGFRRDQAASAAAFRLRLRLGLPNERVERTGFRLCRGTATPYFLILSGTMG